MSFSQSSTAGGHLSPSREAETYRAHKKAQQLDEESRRHERIQKLGDSILKKMRKNGHARFSIARFNRIYRRFMGRFYRHGMTYGKLTTKKGCDECIKSNGSRSVNFVPNVVVPFGMGDFFDYMVGDNASYIYFSEKSITFQF